MPSVAEHDPARNHHQARPTLGDVTLLARQRLRGVQDLDVIGVAWVLLDHLDYRHDSPRYLTCYPGRDAIAERLGIGVKRVTAALKKLCGDDPSAKLFERSRRYNTSTVYTFVVAPEAFIGGRNAGRAKTHTESKGQNGPPNTPANERVKTDRLTHSAQQRVKGPKRTESKGQNGLPNTPKENKYQIGESGRPARAREGSSAVMATPTRPPDGDPVNELVADYGAFQRQHDLPSLKEVRAGLRARIVAADINPQDFRAVLERASRSDLLTGRVPASRWHGQGVSLLWLLNTDNRAKVLAGEYDRRPARVTPHHPRLVSSRAQPLAADAPLDVWAELCEHMNLHVNRHNINQWLRPCRLIADQPTRVIVQAPNEATLTWVEAHYRANLDATLRAIRPGATLVFHTTGDVYELNTATA